jgi:hypothetical protein
MDFSMVDMRSSFFNDTKSPMRCYLFIWG